MNSNAERLTSFIEKIKNLSFFQRLFQWNKTKDELTQIASSLIYLLAETETLQNKKAELFSELSGCKKDVEIFKEQKTKLEAAQRRYDEIIAEKEIRITELSKQLASAHTNEANLEKQTQTLSSELAAIKENVKHLQQDLRDTREQNLQLKNEEETRKTEHSKALVTLEKVTEQVHAEREEEKQKMHEQEIERLRKLKETWSDHQTSVKSNVKAICNRHTIEYVEQVPFKGEPDNTIRICDEYIIFDAKSPANDKTSNFFSYLKSEAEKAKKYAKQENVKTDIFLVVPSNTWDVIKQTCFHLADYSVYIISLDSLEPIILALKKIESYEFAQQLTPEERENICRVIGKFAHLTKRRIQIDSFFARQFMEIVYKCESSLPDDILEKVAEFEKAEKLNPPMEKRAKAISTKQLEIDVNKLDTEIESKGIVVEDLSEGLNGVRLYRE